MAGEEAQKLGTEACLFTMLRMNICLVKIKKDRKKEEEEGGKRNSSIDAFGAAANTDD